MPEQQIDSELLNQTRREIGRLLSEIENLANQDLPSSEFYAEFLRRVSTALAARATAMWMKTPQGNLQLQYHTNLQSIGLDADPSRRQAHDELLRYSAVESKPMLVAPNSGPGEGVDSDQIKNPTDSLLVLAPIVVDAHTLGIIEVFQDAGRRPSAQQGFLKFLTRVANEAAKFLRNRHFRQLVGQQQLWDSLESYTRSVHGGLNPKQAAYLIANDGRKLIACERVSVALKRHRRSRIEAISGQDVVEKRSNLVQRMARLTEKVLKHGENFLYTGTVDEQWPGDIVRALESYLDECPSKMIAIVPLEDQREFGARGKASAALIVEMIEDHPLDDDMGGRIDVVARHGSIALYNALEHQRVFLLPLWKGIGRSTEWVRGRGLPKMVLALALVVGLVASMVYVPWELRLEGKGAFVPETRRIVYAPMDGTIKVVNVDRGDEVDEGSPLAEMSNPDLELRVKSLRGERAATAAALKGLLGQQKAGNADPDVGSKIDQNEKKLSSLDQQLMLAEDQLERLFINSPIRGRVLDWEPREKLLGRPVKQGDVLFEQVAQTDGRWIIEVELPENTITHIARALQRSQDGRLPVSFVVRALPDKNYRGWLYEVSTQARANDEENIVEAKVEIDTESDTPPLLGELAGAEVRVKVECGEHPLGYVLFRELIDFVREYVFF